MFFKMDTSTIGVIRLRSSQVASGARESLLKNDPIATTDRIPIGTKFRSGRSEKEAVAFARYLARKHVHLPRLDRDSGCQDGSDIIKPRYYIPDFLQEVGDIS
jgi:hypothetical protein